MSWVVLQTPQAKINADTSVKITYWQRNGKCKFKKHLTTIMEWKITVTFNVIFERPYFVTVGDIRGGAASAVLIGTNNGTIAHKLDATYLIAFMLLAFSHALRGRLG